MLERHEYIFHYDSVATRAAHTRRLPGVLDGELLVWNEKQCPVRFAASGGHHTPYDHAGTMIDSTEIGYRAPQPDSRLRRLQTLLVGVNVRAMETSGP